MPESEVEYLTVTEALTIYAEIVRASRVERADVQNISYLESALAQPKQTFDGNDLYPTLSLKAAAMLYSLCQNHAFTDGNKRLAFIAMRTFLRQNGHDIEIDDAYDAVALMYSVGKGEIATEKIAEWIESRLHQLA